MFTFVDRDPCLKPYETILRRRFDKFIEKEKQLTIESENLLTFASAHEYFGLHFRDNGWIFREWAPNATAVYLIGDMTNWQEHRVFSLERISDDGVWEIRLTAEAMKHGDHYRLKIYWEGGGGDRIPVYARRVVQDPETLLFTAQVWRPEPAYQWKTEGFRRSPETPYIYEVHVGMAQEAEKVGTFKEFSQSVIPRIAASGYNTIELMAVQEHPYYASFGYQVSNFFAASSRFGTPDDLKELVDTAHRHGLAVIMDLVHSHAVINEVEGLSRFDGTIYQYFHIGGRGFHDAWNSRCFDYNKYQVLHFLLSNCRFWIDEYRFDGFRFDGVTSMMYHHHGMAKSFLSYEDYFDDAVDEDALVYLALANRLVHEICPDFMTIAEDVSGMPGLAVPIADGGMGFDYRFAMGVPDYWIKLCKDIPDEEWHMGHLWYELTNRREDEKTISYTESHDQALVGDQTIIFRLIGSEMYDHMNVFHRHLKIDRGIALHKMIRLMTLATAGNGYLNFMGNEFGHPEWIDFPREGNHWSFRYARRQWHLADDTNLRYRHLALFDRDMIQMAKDFNLLEHSVIKLLFENNMDKTLVFQRGSLLMAFNFHPDKSHSDYQFDASPGKYRMILNTDDERYSGHGRLIPDQEHLTLYQMDEARQRHVLSLYLPARTAMVLQLL